MNNEFLRPRENRCKWLNNLGVMREWVYIVNEDRCKFSSKNNYLSRFTKSMNRFRQHKYTPEEQWRLMRFRQKLNRFKFPRMKIDTVQIKMNRFNASQRVLWYASYLNDSIQEWIDSRNIESIHTKSESLCDTFQIAMNRFICAETEFRKQMKEILTHEKKNIMPQITNNMLGKTNLQLKHHQNDGWQNKLQISLSSFNVVKISWLFIFTGIEVFFLTWGVSTRC